MRWSYRRNLICIVAANFQLLQCLLIQIDLNLRFGQTLEMEPTLRKELGT